MKNRGISPVVATVLLVAMVVALGLIIFLWFRGFTQESVTKFDTNVELVCGDIDFEASYSDHKLSIVNTGNVPIYKMNLKVVGAGGFNTIQAGEGSSGEEWPELGLNQGDTFVHEQTFSGDEVVLIPVLLGTSRGGSQKSFACNEEQYGYYISL